MTTIPYEKLERDGKVALLISPDFGAGWSTWANDKLKAFLLFDRRLVEAVEAGQDVATLAQDILGEDTYFYAGGARDLEVQWLPKGTAFYVDEYDGSESLVTSDDLIQIA